MRCFAYVFHHGGHIVEEVLFAIAVREAREDAENFQVALQAHELVKVGLGERDSTKPMAVLGAGTGLGVAHLIPTAPIAPQNTTDICFQLKRN